ncbi:MAG TPA: S4 domain-containing protein [Egibacteraceae bacterium]|nr:S4 domain-containing protein [Egibacteraceae bacterium]
MDSTRVDRWLWAVRLFKTRAEANAACRGGHVRLHGAKAKPSSLVKAGDTIRVRTGGRERVVEVARVVDRRVGASVAAECLVDHSPPPPRLPERGPVPVRDRGAGRPSKRERRQLERARGRQPR